MALTSAQAVAFQAAHETLAKLLRGRGLKADYSVASLEGLEQILASFRALRAQEPSAVSPAFLRRLVGDAGAYVAEALLRAVPGAELSLLAGEPIVTLPSRLLSGRLRLAPFVRVAKVLSEEEALVGWVAYALVAAGPPLGTGPTNPGTKAGN